VAVTERGRWRSGFAGRWGIVLRLALFGIGAAFGLLVLTGCSSGSAAARPPGDRRASMGTPSAIAFWTVRRGLLGTATARPCVGAVSLTTDGGRSFHLQLRTRGPVEWVTTAGEDEAWALVQTCKYMHVNGSYGVRYRLLRTVDGGRSWRVLPPSEAFNPSFATPTRGIAVKVPLPPAGSIGLPVGQGLLSTSDGGATWRPLRGPAGCRRNQGEAIDSPSPAHTWALCVSQPGAGEQPKELFVSSDGDRTWRLLVNVGPQRRQRRGGIDISGYPLGLSFSKAGFGLLWEDRGLLYLTHDGGRRWQPTGVLLPDIDYGVSGVALSHGQDFLLRRGRHTTSAGPQETDLLRTLDEGHHWTLVHRWQVP
jgi:photosystem II stability/assembly factor-like uncharacterized protein